ncbi:DHHC-type zinc finger family protein [Prunus dulcis]|uniref:DHHC-type zinc finger family protein n=1 Tax=Prunus dulcis TaxID=3755 RepID=A0A4Y1R135_PRUDU|nr:DHHC-type zinc finger family protein [Prunus dulcis]
MDPHEKSIYDTLTVEFHCFPLHLSIVLMGYVKNSREIDFLEKNWETLLFFHSSKPTMKCERFLSIPIFMVFVLIGVVCYVTLFIFIEDWVGLKSSAGSLNALIFISLASLCLFSFFCCVLIDPGYVPASYVPDIEDSEASDQELKKNGISSRRCDKCSTYKPPRAHHCRVCRRIITVCGSITVLVIGTTRPFYACLVCNTRMLVFYSYVWTNDGFLEHNAWNSFGLARLPHHPQYDDYRGIRASWLARKSGQSYRHPYNLSFYKNIISVLGPNVPKWLWPTAVSHLKDGLIFPTPRDNS